MDIISMGQPGELDTFFRSLGQKSTQNQSSVRQARSFLNSMKLEGYYAVEDEKIVSVVLFSREKSSIISCLILPEYENLEIEKMLIRKAVTDLRAGGAGKIAGAFLMSHPPLHIPIREELKVLGFVTAEEAEMAADDLDVTPQDLPREYSLVPYSSSYWDDMVKIKYLGNKGETGNPLVRGVTSIKETEEEARKSLSGLYGAFLPRASLMLLHKKDPVGCTTCIRRPDGVGVLTNVTVLPEYRGKGLGKILVAESLIQLKKLHISRVQLSVVTNNIPAMRIYEGLGFKEIARVCYYRWEAEETS